MKLNYKNERELLSIFRWITKNGMGRRFGSVPIGWYQIHQCNVIEVLEEIAKNHGIKNGDFHVYEGTMFCNREPVATVNQVFEEADRRTRGK